MLSNALQAYCRLYLVQYITLLFAALFFVYSEFGLVPRWKNIKFRLNDPSISKTYTEDEVVSGTECILLSLIISSAVVSWYCVVNKSAIRKLHGGWLHYKPEWISKEFHFYHTSLLCLGLILAINGAITNALKLLIGNTRPDFIARCQPANVNLNENDDTFLTLQSCQQSDKAILYEGLKSTPSGHSSFISCGLGFAFIWQCTYITGSFYKHLWCPVLALIVMISRITDHRHHWYDVLSGFTLGLSVIYVCWKWIFHPKVSTTYSLPGPISV
ncbi:hypothetical protein KAFR_0D04060 [Kazachstania africana CBS 2517]|uniref:Phosphatidic acid phosphatase type 2/haloperoxidase domain-containing protein n=1 Tax=Kazachstania africana (strain ATCC 22294 / BCRC 22015 / CBS 2517 / CECT 1963 / NBRC 1671 / NRRL Y-8276) TaxID=1071382 RepID=H2AUK4_KAZAF|nr:hypothetical protein KAFR_0D04060 [Kazachstania africana CBS 2517]CCF58054.1 hypothetical protein KAFR_0D04060 [Kazachstania africana CBS 2517]